MRRDKSPSFYFPSVPGSHYIFRKIRVNGRGDAYSDVLTTFLAPSFCYCFTFQWNPSWTTLRKPQNAVSPWRVHWRDPRLRVHPPPPPSPAQHTTFCKNFISSNVMAFKERFHFFDILLSNNFFSATVGVNQVLIPSFHFREQEHLPNFIHGSSTAKLVGVGVSCGVDQGRLVLLHQD